MPRLTLRMTMDCNLECKYCYTPGRRDGAKLSVDTFKKFHRRWIEKHPAQPFPKLAFFGGEPCMAWPEVRAITEYAKKNIASPRFVLFTNATLITDKRARYIKENRFGVNVSIDGPEEIHNAARSDWHRTMAGIRILNAVGIVPALLSVLSAQNLQIVERLQWLSQMRARGMGRGTSVGYPFMSECGAWGISTDQVDELEQEYIRAADWLIENPSEPFRQFDTILQNRNPCGCGSPTGQITLTPEGEIHICHRQWDNRTLMGDVENGWSYEIPKQIARKRKRICQQCELEPLCYTGCWMHSLLVNGSMIEPSPIECRVRRFVAREALRMKMERAANATPPIMAARKEN